MIDLEAVKSLSTSEKLQLLEFIWDDLDLNAAPPILSESDKRELQRRREEMKLPGAGLSHEETWRRIAQSEGDAR